MPIHDWTRVTAGAFHDFHQSWMVSLRAALNSGVLPAGYFSMVEQRVAGFGPDVVALQARPSESRRDRTTTAVEPAALPRCLRAEFPRRQAAAYARKADRLVILHEYGRVVALIELVSPGNKSSDHAAESFLSKTAGFLEDGVHVLLIDLFPPTSRDPDGLADALLRRFDHPPLNRPKDRPLTVAAFEAGEPIRALVCPLAVGDDLPAMPVYLEPGFWVAVPLAETYATAWDGCPPPVRELLQPLPAKRRRK